MILMFDDFHHFKYRGSKIIEFWTKFSGFFSDNEAIVTEKCCQMVVTLMTQLKVVFFGRYQFHLLLRWWNIYSFTICYIQTKSKGPIVHGPLWRAWILVRTKIWSLYSPPPPQHTDTCSRGLLVSWEVFISTN